MPLCSSRPLHLSQKWISEKQVYRLYSLLNLWSRAFASRKRYRCHSSVVFLLSCLEGQVGCFVLNRRPWASDPHALIACVGYRRGLGHKVAVGIRGVRPAGYEIV